MEKQSKHRNLAFRIGALILMVGVLAGLFSQSVFARNSYVITDGESVTVHQSYSTDPDVVLDEVGIELSDEDTYTTSYNDGVSCIDIQRMQLVTVDCRGNQRTVGTYGETVGQLLERLGITPGRQDVISCELDLQTYDGLRVDIVHRETEYEQVETVVAYETNYFEDPELEPGAEIVLIEGEDGMIRSTERVSYENGKEVSREIVNTVTITEMVTRLVIRGPQTVLRAQPEDSEYVASPTHETVESSKPSASSRPEVPDSTAPSQSAEDSGKDTDSEKDTDSGKDNDSDKITDSGTDTDADKDTDSGKDNDADKDTDSEKDTDSGKDTAPNTGNTITTMGGTTYTYSEKLSVTCTAYSCEGYTGITATGTVARVGAVAVDPRYIPLGTKMYIVSDDGQYVYGYCVAEDTGGSIKGYKIDLYFDTIGECWDFGVRSCTAYIIQD